MRRAALSILLTLAAGAGVAYAQVAAVDTAELRAAQAEARQSMARSQALEQQAAAATSDAARARAAGEALAARIQASEADITAAEASLRLAEGQAAAQRARLAQRQQPVVRLTAALQTMARRPPALALVQPGSLRDVVHVRSLLGSTLPVIRARTAGLRAEVAEANRLRARTAEAHRALLASRAELQRRRLALAQFETQQRQRSQSLAGAAMLESDRALAFGEEARELSRLIGSRDYQERLGARLAELPGPSPRPDRSPRPGNAAAEPAPARPPYRLPVEGRLLTGVGEISDAGVHARGLTFATDPGAEVVAPLGGRVVFAGPFRGYGQVLIIDHGGGWNSVVTHLGEVSVAMGAQVRGGQRIGRAPREAPQVTVELRRAGRAVAIAPLLAG